LGALIRLARYRESQKQSPASITITQRDLMAVARKQDYRCHQTGLRFDISNGRGLQLGSPSLDRIEHKGPYAADNVRIVWFSVNAFRLNGSDEEAFQTALAMIAHAFRPASVTDPGSEFLEGWLVEKGARRWLRNSELLPTYPDHALGSSAANPRRLFAPSLMRGQTRQPQGGDIEACTGIQPDVRELAFGGFPVPTSVRVSDHEIIHGNCLEVLQHRGFEPVDVAVTSPPYNLNLAYGVYDDSRTEEDYINWIANVATAIKRVLKPNGSFFLNLSGSNSRPYVPFEVMVKLRNEVGFHLQNHITWINRKRWSETLGGRATVTVCANRSSARA
jgi:hypothetical protein